MGFFMGKFQGLRIRGKSVMRVKMQGSKTDTPIFTLKFSLFFLFISNLIKNGYIYRSKYPFQNDLVAYRAKRKTLQLPPIAVAGFHQGKMQRAPVKSLLATANRRRWLPPGQDAASAREEGYRQSPSLASTRARCSERP